MSLAQLRLGNRAVRSGLRNIDDVSPRALRRHFLDVVAVLNAERLLAEIASLGLAVIFRQVAEQAEVLRAGLRQPRLERLLLDDGDLNFVFLAVDLVPGLLAAGIHAAIDVAVVGEQRLSAELRRHRFMVLLDFKVGHHVGAVLDRVDLPAEFPADILDLVRAVLIDVKVVGAIERAAPARSARRSR